MSGMAAMDEEIDHDPTWRFSLGYRPEPRLRLGVQWSPDRDEFGWGLNYIVTLETFRSPQVSVGTSDDRLDSDSGGRIYFVTAAKSFPEHRVAPFLSLSYSEDDGWMVPFGANFSLGGGFSVMPAYDGRKSHLLGTYSRDGWSFTGMWISLKKLGFSVGTRF